MLQLRNLALLLLLLASGVAGQAAAPRISKVLPHLLDLRGRHTLSPSLYERDAYQAFLRQHPDQCSALRFDVNWKMPPATATRLKLRIEARGSREPRPFVLEQAVERISPRGRWTSLTLEGEAFRKAGEIIAWRASLWDGDKLIAEQKSFLW